MLAWLKCDLLEGSNSLRPVSGEELVRESDFPRNPTKSSFLGWVFGAANPQAVEEFQHSWA